MVDSDEEYDRKKRDKFRRERSDYSTERRRSDHEKRSSWREEYNEARKRSRDNDEDRDRGGRYHHGGSPPMGRRDWSPPSKRCRRDGWETLREFGHGMIPPTFGMMDRRPPPWMMGGDLPPHGGGGPLPPGARSMPGDMMMGFTSIGDPRQRGSTMMTFKQFLAQQDDGIDDMEAIRLYHEYKADFKKKQLHQFFNDHKEEDWLLSKYHPKRVNENLVEYLSNVKNRVEVFEWFNARGQLGDVPFVLTDEVVRMMDKSVTLIEGGNENDFKALDTPPQELPCPEDDESKKESSSESPTTKASKPSFVVFEPTPEQQQLATQAKQYCLESKQSDEEEAGERKRPREDSPVSDEEPSDSKRVHEEDATDGTPPPKLDVKVEPQDEQPEAEDEAQPETGQSETSTIKLEPADTISEEQEEEVGVCGPRHLHVTKAVYIRHIPPQISAADILEACQTIPGYLRMAFAEPQPDKGYERRGWVTYSAETNILDVTARISAAKIKGCLLNCQVNKDLSRRVKLTQQVCWARGVVIHDIQQLLKIIDVFDKKGQVWQYAESVVVKKEEEEEEGMETTSAEEENKPVKLNQLNPLVNVPESLFTIETEQTQTIKKDEDGEEEEEEEEGVISDPNTEVLPMDSPMIKVLDNLLWYVRLVHSLDYYNCTNFSDEDHMPHRCGIITVRPKRPESITSEEVAEHLKNMDEKIAPLLAEKKELNEEEMEKLGKRDQESEVEKFIEVNTQKLGENKYLCPLSGKKFRGPDFVRKHILNKHKEALEEVKSDTEYFNNYLKDPDRPIPLDGSALISSGTEGGDHPRGKGGESMGQSQRGPGGGWGGPEMMMQGFPGSRFDHRRGRRLPKPRGSGGGYGGNRGGGPGRRRLMQYEDLDAPVDMY